MLILIIIIFLTFTTVTILGGGTRCYALQDGESISSSLTSSLLQSVLHRNDSARTRSDSTDDDSVVLETDGDVNLNRKRQKVISTRVGKKKEEKKDVKEKEEEVENEVENEVEVEEEKEKVKLWGDDKGRGRGSGDDRRGMTDVGHADCMIIASGINKWK